MYATFPPSPCEPPPDTCDTLPFPTPPALAASAAGMESRSSAWNTIRESDCVALLFPGIRCEFLRLPCPEFPGVLFKLPEDEFS